MVIKGVILNLENIKVGDVFANYPAICGALCEPEKRGSPKDRQIANWERFLKFERQGHKFKILEIFISPIIKIDGRRKGNKSIYIKYTSSLLLNYLIDSRFIEFYDSDYVIEISDNDIKIITGLCNEKYFNHNKEVSQLISSNWITDFDLNLFALTLVSLVSKRLVAYFSQSELDKLKLI